MSHGLIQLGFRSKDSIRFYRHVDDVHSVVNVYGLLKKATRVGAVHFFA